MELTQEQLTEIFDMLLQRQDALMDCDCIRQSTRKAESEHLRDSNGNKCGMAQIQ